MTRRETLVAFLTNSNGFSEAELSAAFAIPTVAGFLARAQSLGISNDDLAARLVAFKQAGNSGLANAVQLITAEFDGGAGQEDKLSQVADALQGVLDIIRG